MQILLLHSLDGQDYLRAVLFPDEWDKTQAYGAACEALRAAQGKGPNDWTWEEHIAPALKERGFTIVNWYHGPTWDMQRVPEVQP